MGVAAGKIIKPLEGKLILLQKTPAMVSPPARIAENPMLS
jgi:hypothetical protein